MSREQVPRLSQLLNSTLYCNTDRISWDLGSVMGPLSYVGDYAVKMIRKMQNEFIKSITPKQDITDLFNEHAQEFIKQSVWSGSCRAWYKSK